MIYLLSTNKRIPTKYSLVARLLMLSRFHCRGW